MRTITCMIVEDEPNAQKLLQEYTSKVHFLSLVHTCYDGLEALEYLKQHPVELLFLDINMPELTGMELADLLKEDQKIIFTTAYSEYALESFDHYTVDYLLKPITFKRFMQSMQKLQQMLDAPSVTSTGKEGQELYVKTGREVVKVSKQDILYIEGLKEYVAIYTAKEKLVVYKRMKELEETLSFPFIRIHNSYIINSDRIQKIDQNAVFINSQMIPIGQTYRKDFTSLISKRLL